MSEVETGAGLDNGAAEQQPKMQASTLLSSCIETAQPFRSSLSDGRREVYITPYYRVPRAGVSLCLVTETQQQSINDIPDRTRVSATLLLLLRGMEIDGVGHPTPVIELVGAKDQSGTVECKRAVAYAFETRPDAYSKPDVYSYLQDIPVIVQAMQNYFVRQASRGRILPAQEGPLCTIIFTPMRREAYLHF